MKLDLSRLSQPRLKELCYEAMRARWISEYVKCSAKPAAVAKALNPVVERLVERHPSLRAEIAVSTTGPLHAAAPGLSTDLITLIATHLS